VGADDEDFERVGRGGSGVYSGSDGGEHQGTTCGEPNEFEPAFPTASEQHGGLESGGVCGSGAGPVGGRHPASPSPLLPRDVVICGVGGVGGGGGDGGGASATHVGLRSRSLGDDTTPDRANLAAGGPNNLLMGHGDDARGVREGDGKRDGHGGGMADGELAAFLSRPGRKRRGRGVTGSRADEPGPFMAPSEKNSARDTGVDLLRGVPRGPHVPTHFMALAAVNVGKTEGVEGAASEAGHGHTGGYTNGCGGYTTDIQSQTAAGRMLAASIKAADENAARKADRKFEKKAAKREKKEKDRRGRVRKPFEPCGGVELRRGETTGCL